MAQKRSPNHIREKVVQQEARAKPSSRHIGLLCLAQRVPRVVTSGPLVQKSRAICRERSWALLIAVNLTKIQQQRHSHGNSVRPAFPTYATIMLRLRKGYIICNQDNVIDVSMQGTATAGTVNFLCCMRSNRTLSNTQTMHQMLQTQLMQSLALPCHQLQKHLVKSTGHNKSNEPLVECSHVDEIIARSSVDKARLSGVRMTHRQKLNERGEKPTGAGIILSKRKGGIIS